MNDQLDLFGAGDPPPAPAEPPAEPGRDRDEAVARSVAGRHARAGDPRTSQEAAAAVDISARCAEVVRAIWYPSKLRDFTDGELAARLPDMDRNVVARRRKDLEDLGIVIPVFEWKDGGAVQRSRTGVKGRPELVWTMHPAERPPE